MELAARLKGEPTLNDVRSVLNELNDIGLDSPSSKALPVLVVLLQHTVVALSPKVDIFVPTFSTPAGLSVLTSRLREILKSTEASEPILRLLDCVLRQPKLVKTLLNKDRISAIQLFWGSKILSSGSPEWFGDTSKYTLWLVTQMMDIDDNDPLLFDKAAKLGDCKTFVGFFMNLERFPKLAAAFSRMRSFQQRYLLHYGLTPTLSMSPVGATARILIELSPSIPDLVEISLKTSVNFQRAVVVYLRVQEQLVETTKQLLKQWAETPRDHYASQNSLTQLLLLCACSLSTENSFKISTSEDFLRGVSIRMESSSSNVRELGMVVAEIFAKVGGGKLDFGQTFDNWVLGIDQPVSSIENALMDLKSNEDLPAFIPPELIKEVHSSVEQDSDDEDITDEEGESTPSPLYIKTLVEYLQSDEYPKHYLSLHQGPPLIKRKKGFGTEVHQYLPELLASAAGLTDKFDIQNFSELRQQLITAILVAEPRDAPPIATRMLVEGDYSLAQRLSILSGFVFASYELSDFHIEEGPSKQLPNAQHNLFISDVDRLSSQFATQLIVTKDNSTANGSNTKRNEFGKFAPGYFYALAAVAPSFEGYGAVLGAQWLKSLALIVHNARLSAYQQDMACELVQVVLGYRSSRDPAVIEALFIVLLCVCESTPDVLFERFPAQVGILYDWIGSEISTLEPSTQRIGASVLVKLQEAMDRIRDRLSAFD